MKDDYLWRKSGAPDAEVERLEKLLARYRYDPAEKPLNLPADGAPNESPSSAHEPRLSGSAGTGDERVLAPPASSGLDETRGRNRSTSRRFAWPTRRARSIAAAMAAVLLVALGIGLWKRGSWSFATPDVGAEGYRLTGIAGRERVRVGEEIVTGEGARATLELGWLGKVDLLPKTRLRVEPSDPKTYRFYLDRGSVHAKIFAEARRFQIDTPAGRSIDLGCEYSLEVGDDGLAVLHVLTGQVAFELDGREVYVPAGATCTSTLARGPSVPLFDDAAADFKRALSEFESSSAPSADALARILACDQEEALSVWHLFASERTVPELRKSLYDRLSRIFAKPQGVTEAGLLSGDRVMRDAWLDTMKSWWRK